MYRSTLLVLPYSVISLSNLYRKKVLYDLWQETICIIFKTFFQRDICIDFSNGERPEEICETKKSISLCEVSS
jgi:hypothetical protein